jgi:hypothetical protein
MVLNNLRKSVEYCRQQLDSIDDVNVQQFELLKGLPFYGWSFSPSQAKSENIKASWVDRQKILPMLSITL